MNIQYKDGFYDNLCLILNWEGLTFGLNLVLHTCMLNHGN